MTERNPEEEIYCKMGKAAMLADESVVNEPDYHEMKVVDLWEYVGKAAFAAIEPDMEWLRQQWDDACKEERRMADGIDAILAELKRGTDPSMVEYDNSLGKVYTPAQVQMAMTRLYVDLAKLVGK